MRTRLTSLIVWLVVGVMVLALASCGGSAVSPSSRGSASESAPSQPSPTGEGDVVTGGTLNWPLGGDPVIYPFTQTATVNSWPAMHTIYDQLVKSDPETFEILPELATSWSTDDGSEWRFELRDDVTWHDGEPFTSADVVFTLEATASPDYGAYHTGYFEGMQAEADGDHAVTVSFDQPRGNLLEILAYNVFIAPEHQFRDLAPDEAATVVQQDPIGTGPFKLSEAVSGDHYTVTANEDYWGGRPNLDAVVFKVIPDPQAQLAQLQSGAIQFAEVSSDSFSALQSNDSIVTRSVPQNIQVIVALNHDDPKFSDARVRRALAMAVDRQGIVDSLFGGHGQAAPGPIMPVFDWAYPKDVEPLPYDPDAAAALLDEAGWTDSNGDGTRDKDGVELNFTVLHWPTTYQPILDVMQEQWRAIGVASEIQILEAAATIGRYRAGDYEAAMTWFQTPLDPDVTNYYGTDGVSNVYNYTNPGDDLLGEASQTTDRSRRAELYAEFQALMREEQPAIFIFYPESLQAISTKVHGLPAANVLMLPKAFAEAWLEP